MRRPAVLERPLTRAGSPGGAVAVQASPDTKLAPRPDPFEGQGGHGERPRRDATQATLGAGGGRGTLGDAVAGAWEALLAAGSARCPVCAAAMSWRGSAGSCAGCGSVLS